MKLVVGLGNPGSKYDNTRHNVGFMVIDYYITKYKIDFKLKSNLKGELGIYNIGDTKAIFLKPTTYMNLSGDSVKAVIDYYNIDIQDIIVICDDLALPTGKVRIRANGSSGGHNGLKSINERIASVEYKRIRVGIDQSEVIPTVDYVLGKFSASDKILITEAVEKCALIIDDFIKGIDFQRITSTRN